jgi:hypothetical protein
MDAREPKLFPGVPTVATAGWTLLSAEERHLAAPKTFEIPTLQERQALRVGDGAKLLFAIESKNGGNRPIEGSIGCG